MAFDLNTLRAIALAAAPGPWHVAPCKPDCPGADRCTYVRAPDGKKLSGAAFREYVAAFDPPTVLALITALDEERATHDALVGSEESWREAGKTLGDTANRLERELAEAKAEVERLRKRNRNMRRALRELNKLNRARTEAIQAISHVPFAQRQDYLLEARGKLSQRVNELNRALGNTVESWKAWPELLEQVFLLRKQSPTR